MIRYVIFSALIFLGALMTNAQDVQFNYDFNGNRIHQEVMTLNTMVSPEDEKNAVDTVNCKIRNAENSFELTIYPNPLHDFLNIIIDGDLPPGKNKVELFTSAGVLIHASEIYSSTNQLDLSRFSSGIYFLTITAGNQTDSWKIIKK